MRPITTVISLVFILSLGTATVYAAPLSAYAGQQQREIKALSPQDVDGYVNGKGMGLARAAELNGYAGPAHVLELGAALALTAEQTARTQALLASMEHAAALPGKALVAAERKLDQLFATQAITPDLLAAALNEIAGLQAQVRGAHLQAHIAQFAILSPEQNARYAQLRGYGAAALAPSQPSDGHMH
jgi:Heavy-metal resistance